MNLLQGSSLAAADPAKGRFRNYLLTLWKRFLIDHARHEIGSNEAAVAYKPRSVALTSEQAWLNWSSLATPDLNADQAFCEQWAANIIETALQRLCEEYQQSRGNSSTKRCCPT